MGHATTHNLWWKHRVRSSDLKQPGLNGDKISTLPENIEGGSDFKRVIIYVLNCYCLGNYFSFRFAFVYTRKLDTCTAYNADTSTQLITDKEKETENNWNMMTIIMTMAGLFSLIASVWWRSTEDTSVVRYNLERKNLTCRLLQNKSGTLWCIN